MAKYNQEIVRAICELIENDSFTIEEICKQVNINKTTYYDWLNTNDNFSNAIKNAQAKYYQNLRLWANNSLKLLVQGATSEETITEAKTYKDGTQTVSTRTFKKQLAPDTTAVIFALKNQDPEHFADQQNVHLDQPINIIWRPADGCGT